jgi:hypothetical protein
MKNILLALISISIVFYSSATFAENKDWNSLGFAEGNVPLIKNSITESLKGMIKYEAKEEIGGKPLNFGSFIFWYGLKINGTDIIEFPMLHFGIDLKDLAPSYFGKSYEELGKGRLSFNSTVFWEDPREFLLENGRDSSEPVTLKDLEEMRHQGKNCAYPTGISFDIPSLSKLAYGNWSNKENATLENTNVFFQIPLASNAGIPIVFVRDHDIKLFVNSDVTFESISGKVYRSSVLTVLKAEYVYKNLSEVQTDSTK